MFELYLHSKEKEGMKRHQERSIFFEKLYLENSNNPMNIIKVKGIRSYSFHGCLNEETKIGGNYITDVGVYCDFKSAATDDDLLKTVDHVEIKEISLF